MLLSECEAMMILKCPVCHKPFEPKREKPYKLVYSHYCRECSEFTLLSLYRTNSGELKEPALYSSSKIKKILVADDAALIHRLIADMLRSEGYEVFVADDGEETIDIMNSIHPDLVILDLYMPGKNGIDILTEARNSEDHRTRPILIISGKCSAPEEIMRLQKLGADGFLMKDAIKETLLFRVKSILEE